MTCRAILPLHRQLTKAMLQSGKYKSPTDGGNDMALNVQFYKMYNHLTEESIVIPRLVNQQSLDFNALCEYLADGSTVTAADVAAVMKQIEMRLPLILGLNAKVVCSPEGLTFRPKVSGSITQSQLKAKLQAKLEADPTLDIDVNRELMVSDLSVSDLTASIGIELPKKWTDRFKSKAEFKRVNKSTTDAGDSSDDGGNDSDNTGDSSNGGADNGGGDDQNGQQTSGNSGDGGNGSGGDNTGGGDDNGGGDGNGGGGNGGADLDKD